MIIILNLHSGTNCRAGYTPLKISRVARRCTLSIRLIKVTDFGFHTSEAYSKCDLISARFHSEQKRFIFTGGTSYKAPYFISFAHLIIYVLVKTCITGIKIPR